MTARPHSDSGASVPSILAISLPAAGAIAVFGTLYGAAARPVLGVPLTLASSLFVFSGALQFALVGLLGAAAAPAALLLTAGALNLRHLVLGAVLRPRIGGSRLRRAALAYFLVDETFGFAVAAASSAERHGRAVRTAAERTLLVSGIVCPLAWQVGTLVGLFGAGFAAVQGVAGAIFPVLLHWPGLPRHHNVLGCRSRAGCRSPDGRGGVHPMCELWLRSSSASSRPCLGVTHEPAPAGDDRIVDSKDDQAVPDVNARPIASAIPSAELEILPDIGHYTFLAKCTLVGRVFVRSLCTDPDEIEREAVHRRVSADALSFFNRTLQGQH